MTKEPLKMPEKGPLTWYACGPTVYDVSHLGHARTYVCFDVIHRILTDYFDYDVNFMMGMTDVDDKIITRAKETDPQGFTADPTAACARVARRFEAGFVQDMHRLGVRPPHNYLRVSEHVPEIVDYVETILQNGFAYKLKASASSSSSSEGGSAEGVEGGVYFDVGAFRRAGYTYAKLRPNSAVSDSEDTAVAATATSSCKRGTGDFALWKDQKAGEPAWQAPWGTGRPGWHIECSAMSSSVFGDKLHLHSGGVDLAFPHHANEIAQCEAKVCSKAWCDQFLHTGHLHISGRKMSKSLKNFISIDAFLSLHTADLFRFFCLSHRYHATLDYSEERMQEAATRLIRFRNFMQTANDFIAPNAATAAAAAATFDATNRLNGTVRKWGDAERALLGRVMECQKEVRSHLRDDFDTPRALDSLTGLVHATNAYLKTAELQPGSGRSRACQPQRELVFAAAAHVSRILRLFGLSFPSPPLPLSKVRSAGSEGAAGEGGLDAVDVTDLLVEFRAKVKGVGLAAAKLAKQHAKQAKTGGGADNAAAHAEIAAELLSLCDQLRDRELPQCGVLVNDTGKHNSTWRPISEEEKLLTSGGSE